MVSSLKLVCRRTFASNFPSSPLRDTFNRPHNYLRVSLTERCNLRCRYCMPKEGIKLSKRDDCLNLEELKRIASVFIKSCGITKVRLTGGEPTISPELKPFLEHLNGLREFGLRTIAMTTNGLTLAKHALAYKNLGLNNVNISLDTLKSDRFELMTLRKGWKNVVAGLERAVELDFDKVKLNCVVMRGTNDDEIVDFARLTERYPIEVRFIEFMPFSSNSWSKDALVTCKEIFEIVSRQYPKLERLQVDKNETSKVFRASQQMSGSIGFISSMSDNFCSGCNRVRLTADGNLKACLFGAEEVSLRDPIRAGASDSELVDLLRACLEKKSKQHAGAEFLEKNPARPMIKIVSPKTSLNSGKIRRTSEFSHLDNRGEACMVNVSEKPPLRRIATAQGIIHVGEDVINKIEKQLMKKGDVLAVARIAGTMGAKKTSELIPLCHQLPLEHIEVEITAGKDNLVVTAQVEATHKTGVEMESLTAVSIALLTIYDMCKSVNKSSMKIYGIQLVSKTKIDIV